MGSHARHAAESANWRVGAASNACVVVCMRAGSIEIDGFVAVIAQTRITNVTGSI